MTSISYRRLWLLSLIFGILITSSAAAVPFFKNRPPLLRLGQTVIGPFAYTHFCVRYKGDCPAGYDRALQEQKILLTSDRLRELIQINNSINRSIVPRRYENDTTFDTWRINPESGDCNDFAVSKRHALLINGWPPSTLLLAEVLTTAGELHLVLLVHTAAQDLVLDNLNSNVKLWSKTTYTWLRVQSPKDPPLWVAARADDVN